MIHYLVFDIETRVDKELVKQIYDPEECLTLDQAYDTARASFWSAAVSRAIFPVPYHIPIAISTLQADENYRIRSLRGIGVDRHSEKELVCKFWEEFENTRTLVTFNGRGFDLPVLETQALKHGLSLSRYFGTGEGRSTFRGNRYSDGYHIDLCDFLSNYGASHRNSINLYAKLIGLPGKYTIAGEDVEYLFRQGRQKEINQYCMTDVLQTYLLFLRVELLRGKLGDAAYQAAVAAARQDLTQRANNGGSENFLVDFLQRWKPSAE
jgi:predicted PolB exonuclease-like 3'-5' exonuclease